MKLHWIAFLSRLLNLCLVCVVVWLWRHPAAARRSPPSLQPPAPVETAQRFPEVQPKQISSPTNAPFRWSRIASNDLKEYRDHLHGIGCPRSTVRDIILAEINERFEGRRQDLLAAAQGRFWDLALRGESAMRAEWEQPLEDLNLERERMIHDVLGKDYDVEETERQVAVDHFQRRLAWLPPEKFEQLQALEQKKQKEMEDWAEVFERAPDQPVTDEYAERPEAIQKEYDNARKELLTPGELEEFQLRESEESHWTEGLSGFEPTEAQWRAVSKLRMAYRQDLSDLGSENLSDDERRQRAEKLDNALKQSMKEVLGEEYYHYEMASDGNFQQAVRVTQRYGLPNTLAEQAYQLRKSALAAADAVRSDANLSDDERQARLTALRQKTEHDFSQALGDKVFSTYREYAGGWLKNLGTQ